MKTCVILAGGKSSRMGRDKTLLPFGGFATLTHYGAHKFGRIFERVFVSSKFEKFDPPLPLIKDVGAKEISQLNLARAYEKNVNLQDCGADIFSKQKPNLTKSEADKSVLKNSDAEPMPAQISKKPSPDDNAGKTPNFSHCDNDTAQSQTRILSQNISNLISKNDSALVSDLEQSGQENKILSPQNLPASQIANEWANLSVEPFSPMLALYSILRNFKNESVFIVPADMPFVSEECVRELYKFASEYDMVIAADDSHTHSLCGFFSANLADAAGELFAAGEHKIGLLRSRCRCKIIKFARANEFFNINYPSDYERALKEGKI